LPSREFPALLEKELRELMASRAYWLLLLMMGPLLGHGFITAVDAYAEASGIGGGPSALAQGLTPLDGIFVPAFGAYDLAATFLFPFVAIRLVSGERESGAWKLMAQTRFGAASMMAAKAVALGAGMAVAWLPGLTAVVLWKWYGGALYAPELLTLLLGHALRTIVSAGVAVAAAAIAKNSASAAIATLGFTVGTWALDFVAAGRGGLLQKLAAFTPASALRVFEQGELRLSTVVVSCLVGLMGFAMAAIWSSSCRSVRWRAGAAIAAAVLLTCVAAGASFLRPTWDLSENHRNSFPAEDVAALRRIAAPLRVTVYLAPEDPRLLDLERNVLSKLQRVLNHVEITYAAKSQTGLFEAPGDRYGEIWYEIGGRKTMSRSATEPIVLDTLYRLAGFPPVERKSSSFAGHPLQARPVAAGWIFYLFFPFVTALAWRLQWKIQE
jgi:ABC-2 type transport system permease protein